MPGLILLTFLSLIVPEIVVGGASAYESFGRSWRTVRGYAWHVFGTYVLVFVIMIVGQYVVELILLALPYSARNSIANFVVGTLFAPFLAAVVTLVYDRLKLAHGQRPEPGTASGTPRSAGTASTTAPRAATGLVRAELLVRVVGAGREVVARRMAISRTSRERSSRSLAIASGAASSDWRSGRSMIIAAPIT